MVINPNASPPRLGNPKLLAKITSGDGRSAETAYVIADCRDWNEVRKVEAHRLYLFGFGGAGIDTNATEVVNNHQYHIYRSAFGGMDGDRPVQVVYFDVTTAIHGKSKGK